MKILVEEGDEAPIGSLAVIGSEGDSLDELDLKLPSNNTPSNNEDSAVVDSADNLEEVTHTGYKMSLMLQVQVHRKIKVIREITEC